MTRVARFAIILRPMARPRLKRPTDVELEVLRVIWAMGPSTARDLRDQVQSAAGHPIHVSTFNSTVHQMVERGYLVVTDNRRPFKYGAAVSRDQTYTSLATELTERVFGSSIRDLIKHALRGRKATKQDIAELRKIVEELEE